MSVLLIVTIVFATVLILNRVKVNLAISLLIGTALLGILMRSSARLMSESLIGSCFQRETLQLLLIVSFILVMSRLMKETGQMARIVSAFQQLTSDGRLTSSVLPALIGILPMPGGALFSAPMVDEGFRNTPLSSEHKSAVNYWFRHVWEYWWPLYPGVILAVSLLGVPTWQFSLTMLPMTVMTILAGIVFLLRPIKNGHDSVTAERISGRYSDFIRAVLPILIIVASIVIVSAAQAVGAQYFNIATLPGLAILVGLSAGLLYVIATSDDRWHRFVQSVKNRELLSMMTLILAIMIFRGLLEDTGAITAIRDELAALHFPVFLIIVLLPFLSGIITGIAIGFVGLSFPLIIPLFQGLPLIDFLGHAALAYTAGYLGMMLSPVHLCFLVTKDYFHASLMGIYPLLVKPISVVFLFSLLMFMLLSMI